MLITRGDLITIGATATVVIGSVVASQLMKAGHDDTIRMRFNTASIDDKLASIRNGFARLVCPKDHATGIGSVIVAEPTQSFLGPSALKGTGCKLYAMNGQRWIALDR